MNRRGFTLVELMVAALVMGALTALSAPTVSRSYRRWSGELAVDRFVRTGEYARERAVVSGAPVRLSVEGISGRVELLAPNEAGVFIPLEDRRGRAFSLPEGLSARSEPTELDFFPDGTSSAGTVRFSLPGGDEKRFDLEPLLGRFREKA